MTVITQYIDRVPYEVRSHAESLMIDWRADGRNDERIENIVMSVVLNAYVYGYEVGVTTGSTSARVPGDVPFCAGRAAVAHPRHRMDRDGDGWKCSICGEGEP